MHLHHFWRRLLFTTVFFISAIYILHPPSNIANSVYYFFYPKESIQCYHVKSNTLPEISDAEPTRDSSIFFHETSCNSYYTGKIAITARQACAVESAALLNPNSEIYLLFASPGLIKFEGSESDRFLKALLSYNNVKIRHLDFENYSKGSPVEELYKTGKVDGSGYAQSHASDVLRYLTLWKFGGIYLDLDVIVTKPLENLPQNFAGSESESNVAAGVLSFSSSNLGHEFAHRCLNDLKENFSGSEWGYNGPGVITRLLRKLCGVDLAKDMLGKGCQGFKVYPPKSFYPVAWWNWGWYFDEDVATRDRVLELSKESLVVHVWNKHSVRRRIGVGSRAAYVDLAKKFCPRVFSECDRYF